MANVTGPTTNLPGSSRQPPEGTVCDNHSFTPAYRRVTGETDSHGSEEHDLCKSCWTKLQTKVTDIRGHCAWCKQMSDNLKPIRDYEEGLCGPVYDVCPTCRHNSLKAAQEELFLMHAGHYDEDEE